MVWSWTWKLIEKTGYLPEANRLCVFTVIEELGLYRELAWFWPFSFSSFCVMIGVKARNPFNSMMHCVGALMLMQVFSTHRRNLRLIPSNRLRLLSSFSKGGNPLVTPSWDSLCPEHLLMKKRDNIVCWLRKNCLSDSRIGKSRWKMYSFKKKPLIRLLFR